MVNSSHLTLFSLQLHSVLWVGGASCLYTLTTSSLSKWDVNDSWEHQVLSWDAHRALTESIADAIWVCTQIHVIINTVYQPDTAAVHTKTLSTDAQTLH